MRLIAEAETYRLEINYDELLAIHYALCERKEQMHKEIPIKKRLLKSVGEMVAVLEDLI